MCFLAKFRLFFSFVLENLRDFLATVAVPYNTHFIEHNTSSVRRQKSLIQAIRRFAFRSEGRRRSNSLLKQSLTMREQVSPSSSDKIASVTSEESNRSSDHDASQRSSLNESSTVDRKLFL